MENNLMVMQEDERFIADLTAARQTTFNSFIPKTTEEKIALYNAMNNPEKRLKDCINETILVKHVFCEIVEVTNKETGEIKSCPRIVLIDPKGTAYQCVSVGIYSALKKLFQCVGLPDTWEKPIKLKVIQISKGDRSLLTLNMIP